MFSKIFRPFMNAIAAPTGKLTDPFFLNDAKAAFDELGLWMIRQGVCDFHAERREETKPCKAFIKFGVIRCPGAQFCRNILQQLAFVILTAIDNDRLWETAYG